MQACTLQGGASGDVGLGNGVTGGNGFGFTTLVGTARPMELRSSILDSRPTALCIYGQPGESVEYVFSQLGQFAQNVLTWDLLSWMRTRAQDLFAQAILQRTVSGTRPSIWGMSPRRGSGLNGARSYGRGWWNGQSVRFQLDCCL